MKKSVVITTDSVCDLPQDLLQRFQVQMIPLTVTEGEHSYKDGAGITPDDIYRIYDEQKILPKTSAISPRSSPISSPPSWQRAVKWSISTSAPPVLPVIRTPASPLGNWRASIRWTPST